MLKPAKKPLTAPFAQLRQRAVFFWTLSDRKWSARRSLGRRPSFFLFSLCLSRMQQWTRKTTGSSLLPPQKFTVEAAREARMALAGVIKNKRKKKPHRLGCEGLFAFLKRVRERRGFCRRRVCDSARWFMSRRLLRADEMLLNYLSCTTSLICSPNYRLLRAAPRHFWRKLYFAPCTMCDLICIKSLAAADAISTRALAQANLELNVAHLKFGVMIGDTLWRLSCSLWYVHIKSIFALLCSKWRFIFGAV